tara:strand:- start:22392 stop:23585 length:1194 start_codon:yes stop_codon:yes gene_type:complete
MEQFVFPAKAKRISFILMGVGILSLILGVVLGYDSNRIWSNVLINGWFFFGIGVIGTFFVAVQYAAQAGWGTVLKRVFEAISQYTYVGAGILILVFIASSLHWNHIYHWMDSALYDPSSHHYDPIIANKEAYLNLPFWWARVIIFLSVFIFFTYWFRKKSIQEDLNGGVGIYKKSITMSAIFLVFFGYSSIVITWDWLMSIDTHWFSTLYGWYLFSGIWLSSMVCMYLLTAYLKKLGYLEQVNDSHIHDLGKWIFAVSFLWTYLFFSQFMLIWYSDMPEEVTYYIPRIEDYGLIFWGMVLINFIFPMLLLMSKDTKRNIGVLTFVSIIILIGHWLDVYMLITPGVMKAEGHLGWFEIGLALGFVGSFIFVVLNAMTKAGVMVKNHPMLDESLHHHIN